MRYALTAFSGAERFAPLVRYNKASIYVEKGHVEALAEAFSLKSVEGGAGVELIEAYDEGVFYVRSERDEMQVADPIQFYLDLSTLTSGRGREGGRRPPKRFFGRRFALPGNRT